MSAGAVAVIFLILFVVLGILGIVRLVRRQWVSGGILLAVGIIGGSITFASAVAVMVYG